MSLKMFPATLRDGQKLPLINGWKFEENASNDPAQLKRWQDYFQSQLTFWGIPTGPGNDLFVLDVDIKPDDNGFETIQKNNLLIPDTASQRTIKGGAHYLFKYPKDGKHYGNKVKFMPGLDTRGAGGWIAYYGVDWSKPILEAPEWLLQAVQARELTQTLNASVIGVAPEIAQGIFLESLEAIRSASPGESNNILNTESFRVGQLVASNAITRQFAEEELFKAAKDRGKPDYESRATIKSGLDGGVKSPLTSPFPSDAPSQSFDIPTVPTAQTAERWTPQLLTRHDLLNVSKLRKPQLFKDWSTEDIQITTADGGTGKTTLKLYEAICLALGDRFLGLDCKQSGKTLYITGEDTVHKLGAMLGAIMNQMGLFDGSPENEHRIQTILESIVIKKDADLCLISKDRQGFLHMNQTAFEKVSQAIVDLGVKMVVFDPIASFWGSESALNDMNKAVTKFCSGLVEKHHVCVEMINHMGKSSSAQKDMSQFAGRGGSGLPSNSRVSRVLRSVDNDEYAELTGLQLEPGQTAMMCQVNKFSDGSDLFNKPFVIIRDGFLFKRLTLAPQKLREMESQSSDNERVFTYIKEQRNQNKFPTKSVIVGHFMAQTDPLSEAKIKRAIDLVAYSGHLGEKIARIENPDQTSKDPVYIVTDMDGRET